MLYAQENVNKIKWIKILKKKDKKTSPEESDTLLFERIVPYH